MATTKMLMMLIMAAILFCSHQQAIVAREVDMSIDFSPAPKSSCSASDQKQVKKCMTEIFSAKACCPTFKRILGTSCPCYKYAEDLDNQMLITIEAYCDVDSPNPCKNVQVIKLSKEEE
ncbi:hypothetical protein K7X08_007763 [Anisodus acutangulus]|uniref:Bifunctional inhibitor/plant lipid transfer protein/seed storage helical domain-containing protein n=1 Tax=Anisodus acutangulus TaxID=402998 RepID=A0A9Q1MP28_9SOLA|nr:hypothetical protein K7X08_007763 [Anisodus acutangulus]